MNFSNLKNSLAAAVICGAGIVTANAALAGPMIGSISTVEFGDGNSPDNWIVDTVTVGGGSVELGIKAKNRFVGDIIPTAGFVYQSEPGNPPTSGSDPTPAAGLTIWNFEWSAIFTDLDPGDFVVMLGVDFKPNDPDISNRFFFDVTSVASLADGVFQGSQNIGFSFWQAIGDPAIMPIDPFAAGTYQFSIELLDATNGSASRIDMTVQVPEPEMIALFGLGLLGMTALRRRKVLLNR